MKSCTMSTVPSGAESCRQSRTVAGDSGLHGVDRMGRPVPGGDVEHDAAQLTALNYGLDCQFKTTTIGDVGSSTTAFIRNRCPSVETMYCCLFAP
jgi:hypothetical protein